MIPVRPLRAHVQRQIYLGIRPFRASHGRSSQKIVLRQCRSTIIAYRCRLRQSYLTILRASM